MIKSSAVPLSVLDTAPVWKGSTPAQSLRDMMDLAKNVERLGYRRYWVAEHHNTLSIASSSPAVLVGQLAGVTSTLRVGSGGVMLPNHPPLVIAEQFGTLEALHQGRIDLGIGRAPGTDPTTAKALRRTHGEVAGDFPGQLAELMAYFNGPVEHGSGRAINAIPAEGNSPRVWLLGSSSSSAEVAGRLGLPFAFAHHINPANTLAALEAYRQSFTPSVTSAAPYVLVCVMVIAADNQERAEWLSSSLGLMVLRMSGGLPQGQHTPPEEASAYPYTPEETELIKQQLSSRIIGGPDTVRHKIHDVLMSTKADELMVVTLIHGQANRIRSYELVAEAVLPGQSDQDPISGADVVQSGL